MTKHRELLLRAAANEAGLPAAFAVAVAEECPWLSGNDEISQSLGLDLLDEQIARFAVEPSKAEDFFHAFNARVRESGA